ncbi:MAG TPA: glycosyltransferase family 4 protein [Pyrinomonadaceae bacterium]|nr:glycosyltransferase family 4 protein [Pyrinomonadaceae bacterium]
MKVVLLALSGDLSRWRDKLVQLYPDCSLELISRAEFETGSHIKRLKSLRARHPDVLAIATERLPWQRGQNLFMVFGALAGAREVLMIDAHGGLVRKSRANLLAGAPVRLGRETLTGMNDVAQSRRELQRLEQDCLRSKERLYELTHRSQPRVVYLRATPGPGTQAGGAASHIKGVVEGLQTLGAHVEIISNDQIAGLNFPRFTVIPPQPGGGSRALFDIHNNLVFTRGAVPLIERAEPDFIYQRYARFSWAGVVAAMRIKRPLFLEYNGSEVWVGRHWDRVGSLDLLERYERLNLDAAARIFVVSEVERRNLEARGVRAEKIVVNPNGVDVERFRPGVGGVEARREVGIRDDEVVAGFVGTFGPWHGVEKLAEAIKSITTGGHGVPPLQRPNVRFLLVGSGSLQAEVETQLESETKAGRVIFTGAVAHDRVPKLLDACDILVAPHVPLADGSEFFGSPTKIFEYMAMGKGIVASRLGQIGEVLVNEETALLVEPGNVDELGKAIVRLIESETLRMRLGARAREVAERKHTWMHNAQRVLDAYQDLKG